MSAVKLFSFLFRSRSKPPVIPTSNPESAGKGLRQIMLASAPAAFGAEPTDEFPRLYAVLMEWPIGDHTATVLSSSSGSASLYTTSTFGIIGGEGHENVRAAAIRFVRAADGVFDASSPTTEFPYPAQGRVRFYLLTFKGVRFIDCDIASIENGTSAYAKLFDLGQSVLTELRVATMMSK